MCEDNNQQEIPTKISHYCFGYGGEKFRCERSGRGHV